MIGMVDLSGKGSKIHGIVEEYVAKGNISTGGFVKYLRELIKDNELISTDSVNITNIISAVKLDDNTVFIVHNNGSNTVKYYSYGVVCKIQDNEIIVGTDTQLFSNYNRGMSIVALNQNKVFIAYSPAESSYLRACICTVDGTNITVGDMSYLATDTGSDASVISAAKLSESKVFVAYSHSSTNQYLYGVACTISGNTVTRGLPVQLNYVKNSGKVISTTALNQNTVFIAHSDVDDYSHGMICTISGTTITVETDTQLSTSGTTVALKTALQNNKIIILDCKLYLGVTILLCTVSDINNITVAIKKDGYKIYPKNAISLNLIHNNEMFIPYCYDGSTTSGKHYLYGMFCEITETDIIKERHIKLSLIEKSALAISSVVLGTNIFIAHSQGSYALNGMLVDLKKYVQTATQADKIYRRSTKQSIRRTTRQGRKTKLYRGGKLKCIF